MSVTTAYARPTNLSLPLYARHLLQKYNILPIVEQTAVLQPAIELYKILNGFRRSRNLADAAFVPARQR